jgi:hypothetical protein
VVGGLSINNGNYSVRYAFLILSLALIRWLTCPVSMAVLPSYTTVHITPTRLKCHVSPALMTALIEVFIATSLVDETHSITMTNLEADKQFSLDYLVSNSTSDPSRPDLAGIAISDPVDVGGVSPSDPIADGPSNIALIGGIIGGIVGISFLVLLCLILRKRQQKAKKFVLGDTVHRYDRRDTSATSFQIDLISQEVSPFTSGLYTYQDSPCNHKSSPLSGPPQTAFAFHSYLSGVPRSPASPGSTFILGQGPPSTRQSPNRHPHSRQQSISEYTSTQSQSSKPTREGDRSDVGTFGPNGRRTSKTMRDGSSSEESGGTGISPRPRGAQFSLPAISLPPKMFVLGLDGEVEPLGTGRESRTSLKSGQF